MIRNKFATKESGGKSMIVELENETIIFIALSKTSIYCSMVEPVKLKLFCDDAKDENVIDLTNSQQISFKMSCKPNLNSKFPNKLISTTMDKQTTDLDIDSNGM